jgi:uncharacterized Fe-S cluster-containing radical SAM superfamily protein
MDILKRSDRELHLPRNRYPQLGKNVSLHMSPSYALVLYGNPPKPLRVSNDTIDILACCNGMQTVGDILINHINANNRSNDVEISKAIVTLAGLIREKIVILDKKPKKVELQIAGSRTIFYPTNLQVELTTACNLRCSYCYRKSGSNEAKGRLATSKLLEILRVLSDNGLHSVELTGGEPLLHPDFIQIVRFCGERFSIIGLLTNGTLITESLIKELLPFRKKMVISVSLDSHIRSVHDDRRGQKGAFDKTTNGLRLLSRQGFLTRVSMSVDQMHQFYPLAEPNITLDFGIMMQKKCFKLSDNYLKNMRGFFISCPKIRSWKSINLVGVERDTECTLWTQKDWFAPA